MNVHTHDAHEISINPADDLNEASINTQRHDFHKTSINATTISNNADGLQETSMNAQRYDAHETSINADTIYNNSDDLQETHINVQHQEQEDSDPKKRNFQGISYKVIGFGVGSLVYNLRIDQIQSIDRSCVPKQ